MPIQLDKILGDIANEKVLHPNYQGATKKGIDDAWSRVGKNSHLSGVAKKYEQEKQESSAWKLFSLMDQIHKKEEPKLMLKRDEEYEMLEVQEEEDNGQPNQSGESASEAESPTKLHVSNTSDKEDTTLTNLRLASKQHPTNNAQSGRSAGSMHGVEVGKTIQLPDSLKRKLSGRSKLITKANLKANQQNTPQSSNNASTSAKIYLRKGNSIRPQLNYYNLNRNVISSKIGHNISNASGINLITIPANPSATGLVNGLISTGGGGPSSSTGVSSVYYFN
ncbi:hypothetical protein EVAR_101490_1 [Eumeta japonica]|uniref:MADF domain-containing protein n=1 Tax=Eumeta variegata TaxID=151549 RepID=A0A4C1T7W2_EUMVA|nr:hypothetical protein EVAR_101490_1 [Eumeta japonica]